jgi:hypothetical protein
MHSANVWFFELTSCALCMREQHNETFVWFPSAANSELLPVCTSCIECGGGAAHLMPRPVIIEVNV